MKPLGFSCAGFPLSSGYCSARAAHPLRGSQQHEPRVQFRSCLALMYFKLQPANLPSSFDLPELIPLSNAHVSSCHQCQRKGPPRFTEYLLWALVAAGKGCLTSSQLTVPATLVWVTSSRLHGHGRTINSVSCPYHS